MILIAIGITIGISFLARSPQADAPPRPVGLVEPFSVAAPLAGLRCSGLLADGVLVTARHCLTGPAIVVGDTLCDGSPEVGRVTTPDPNPPTSPSTDDVAWIRLSEGDGPRSGEPNAGRARVGAFGTMPATGRATCAGESFEGSLDHCPTGWCLDTGDPAAIPCEGSSGAPVFQRRGDAWLLVGVVSGGPPCGHAGPIIVAAPIRATPVP